jgi:hypothetical protein
VRRAEETQLELLSRGFSMTYYPEECRSQPSWGARLGDVGIWGECGGSLEVRDRGATTRITSRSGEVPRVIGGDEGCERERA